MAHLKTYPVILPTIFPLFPVQNFHTRLLGGNKSAIFRWAPVTLLTLGLMYFGLKFFRSNLLEENPTETKKPIKSAVQHNGSNIQVFKTQTQVEDCLNISYYISYYDCGLMHLNHISP